MRSIWKGQMGFGLISLPVKLYGATDSKGISFHLMHQECGGGRISYLYKCRGCGAILENRSALKKGYEYAKDHYVILEEQDFQALPLKTLKQIEIVGFTEDELDPRAFDATYYLSPEKGGEKPYQLLLSVMERLNVRAVGKLAYREREHICMVSPFDGIMLLHTLCYADEIRDYEEIKPMAVALGDRELELGETLVRQMMMAFDLSAFKDDYREALEALIEAKIEGREIAVAEEAPAPAGDLVDQLLASIGMK